MIVAAASYLLFAIPHTAYHLFNLEPYPTGDAIANVLALAATVPADVRAVRRRPATAGADARPVSSATHRSSTTPSVASAAGRWPGYCAGTATAASRRWRQGRARGGAARRDAGDPADGVAISSNPTDRSPRRVRRVRPASAPAPGWRSVGGAQRGASGRGRARVSLGRRAPRRVRSSPLPARPRACGRRHRRANALSGRCDGWRRSRSSLDGVMRTRRGTTATRSACAALALAAVLGIASPARADEQAASAPVAEAVVGDPARSVTTGRRAACGRPSRRSWPRGRRSSHRGAATSDGAGAVRQPRAVPACAPRSTPAPPALAFRRVHGKVFFTIQGGRSRATISARPRSWPPTHTLAWTAGHCVNDAQFGGGFAASSSSAAAQRRRRFGTWPAGAVFTQGWGGDIASARTWGSRCSPGRGARIEDVLGARGRASRSTARTRRSRASGIRRSRTRSPCRRASTSTSGCVVRFADHRVGQPATGRARRAIVADMTGGRSNGVVG